MSILWRYNHACMEYGRVVPHSIRSCGTRVSSEVFIVCKAQPPFEALRPSRIVADVLGTQVHTHLRLTSPTGLASSIPICYMVATDLRECVKITHTTNMTVPTLLRVPINEGSVRRVYNVSSARIHHDFNNPKEGNETRCGNYYH